MAQQAGPRAATLRVRVVSAALSLVLLRQARREPGRVLPRTGGPRGAAGNTAPSHSPPCLLPWVSSHFQVKNTDISKHKMLEFFFGLINLDRPRTQRSGTSPCPPLGGAHAGRTERRGCCECRFRLTQTFPSPRATVVGGNEFGSETEKPKLAGCWRWSPQEFTPYEMVSLEEKSVGLVFDVPLITFSSPSTAPRPADASAGRCFDTLPWVCGGHGSGFASNEETTKPKPFPVPCGA